MPANIGLYSYLTALLAYGGLSVLLVFAWRERRFTFSVLAATLATAVWGGTVALATVLEYPPVAWMQAAELLRNLCWLFLLLNLLGQRLEGSAHPLAGEAWRRWFWPVAGLSALLLVAGPLVFPVLPISGGAYRNLIFSTWLGMAVVGLLLLEQIYRNGTQGERWSSKYLCLGLGLIFSYDFFMYAEALLLQQLDTMLWQARGVVVSLAVPLLAVAIARNTNWKADIQISRHVVFHSVTLFAAGIYLILMAVVGYFVRILGGNWGGVLQVTFLVAAGLLLVALLFSGKIRAETRVWLSKNFFSYKYDYREQWLQFTERLSAGGDGVPITVVSALASLVNSPAGLLWSRQGNRFYLATHWNMPEPEGNLPLGDLPDWLQSSQWIIDLGEWQRSPDIYEGLVLPPWLTALERGWLVIPLMFNDSLQGILYLRRSDLHPDLNWEDRDLLKVAGRQAGSHLAQYQASTELVEARQFEAFNRLSAYVIHDLKNILAQQSLIVSNAERHKTNPAFVDDVIDTVRNSVVRMQRLMEQMRTGVRGSHSGTVSLLGLLQRSIEARAVAQPVPILGSDADDALIDADSEQLATVFGHVLQNAQEATDRDGEILVTAQRHADTVTVNVSDTGCGMDEAFVRDRLFKPFDSTKGLTGMGIGAFESREFVRSLGGDITVTSAPGVGSTFSIVLPCSAEFSEQNTAGETGDSSAANSADKGEVELE